MTPNEFKAWFDGFTEAFEGRIPTKVQWGRIKDRVAEIDGKPVTHTVYLDRYLSPYPYLRPYWSYLGGTTGSSTTFTTNLQQDMAQCNSSQMQQYSAGCNNISNTGAQSSFNSLSAMADLGRAEAANLAS